MRLSANVRVWCLCAALSLVSFPVSGFRLLVLHTNDMHSRFDQIDLRTRRSDDEDDDSTAPVYGGFPRLKTAVRRERERARDDPNVDGAVFVNAGDTWQGTELYQKFGRQIAARMLSELGVDVMTLGIHEFDDGINSLESFIMATRVPVVVCNLKSGEWPITRWPPVISRSKILTVGGRQIGIVGYLTPDIMKLKSTLGICVKDEIQSIKDEVGHLKNHGVDIIIALGHSGYEMDQKIAREVEGVDVVVGGRSHTFLNNETLLDLEEPAGPYPTHVVQNVTNRTIPVVQAFHSTKYLGKLYVEFDDKGQVTSSTGNPILLDSSIAQDAKLLKLVNKYQKNIEPEDNEVIGSTDVFLEGSLEHCMLRECNFGNFLLDSYVNYASQMYAVTTDDESDLTKYWTDAPIAMLNSWAIRYDISLGQITHGQLSAAIPFKNHMGTMKLIGADIKRAFEHVFWNYKGKEPQAEFLQVSGLHVVIDLSKESGKRVRSIGIRSREREVVDYQELDPGAHYTVIVSDHLWVGRGTGYIFTKLSDVNRFNKTLFDVARITIGLNSTPISPKLDGRITLLNAENIYNADIETPTESQGCQSELN